MCLLNLVSNFSFFLNLFLFLVSSFFLTSLSYFFVHFSFCVFSLSATFAQEWKSLFSVFSSQKKISLFCQFLFGRMFLFFLNKSFLSTCFSNFVFWISYLFFPFVVPHKKTWHNFKLSLFFNQFSRFLSCFVPPHFFSNNHQTKREKKCSFDQPFLFFWKKKRNAFLRFYLELKPFRVQKGFLSFRNNVFSLVFCIFYRVPSLPF